MSEAEWKRKSVLGLNLKEVSAVLGFYFLMATAYYVTLIMNVRSFQKPGASIWAAESFGRILLDYLLKLLLTIPIWILIFRTLKGISLKRRFLVHLVGLPLFVWCWQQIYYFLCDNMGYGRLTGDGQVWDVYIPGLFYVLQFSLFHVYDYYRQLQKQEKIASDLKELALKSETHALKAQIQPHFLFNTLNSISAGLPPAEEHTRELIARLADTFRFAMQTAQKEKITVAEELEFIKNYLSLEQERFDDRLAVEYHVDPQTLNGLIPPLLLQPIVENALKHGIGKSMEGGKVIISIASSEKNLVFSVADTGAGINGYTQGELLVKGIGLQNTSLRLRKMYNEELSIRENSPRGAIVKFSIPYLT